MPSTTWFRRQGACHCSTGWRAARAPRGACTRCSPSWSAARASGEQVLDRMTAWFVARLPAGGDDQGRRWTELHDESAALTEWLGQVPEGERVRIERAGSRYAICSGPFHAWLRFCEEMLAGSIDRCRAVGRALDAWQCRAVGRAARAGLGCRKRKTRARPKSRGGARGGIRRGAYRRHSADAGRSRRGAADPARGAIAGLRAARRRALGGGDQGADRRHSADAGRSRRGAADPARGGNCRSSSGSATCARRR